MKHLRINTPSKSYPVYIGQGIRFEIDRLIQGENLSYSSYFIITDENIAPLYLEDIKNGIQSLNESVYHFVVPAGEASKSFEQYQHLLTEILACRPDRMACIIAVGGGVVGDLAGFVAATLLRGIGFIQIPTTVLAHDSSVGGKVAINHTVGKNLIGSFYHPDMIVYDTETLKTLPERELISGFAEVIKHGLIYDKDFYLNLRQTFNNIDDLQNKSLDEALYNAIQIKADIVNRDEKEQSVRTYLNFGHTLGHAIEKECGYGVLTHGEAVSIGIVFAIELSEHYYHNNLPKLEIIEWFKQLRLPIELPQHVSKKRLVTRMYHDKKTMRGVLRFVLMKEVGQVETQSIDPLLVEKVLSIF